MALEPINQLKTLSILFVEDDDIARDMMVNLLRRVTDNLIVRSNGEEGLEAFKEFNPDIVISDIKMPKMNGVEMATHIKEINKNAAIVFITAHKEPMLVVKAVELGVKRFIFKPVRLKQLKEVLQVIGKEISYEKELQRKEEQVQEERNLTEKILNTQNNIVILSNKHEGIVKINNRFFDYFPYESLDDFKSRHSCICELFIEDINGISKQEDIENIADFSKERDKKFIAKAYDKYGQLTVFAIAVERIMLNQAEHFVITLNDITLEELSLEKAKDIDRIKSEFFTNMSHEIRTPINGIIGFADLLEESLSQKELVNYAHIIGSSAKSLLNIINDILDYSKIEEGKLELEHIECDISKEVESVAELFYAESMQKRIDLLVMIDPFFPSCVMSDPLRIRQILSNLLSNSMKFTQEGGKVRIDVKYVCNLQQECAEIYIAVTDTGIGIPKEKQRKIFEAFSQADTTTTREFGGTGLGLTISSKLVNLLGSHLELESEVGKGSRFFFTIKIDECETSRVKLPAFKPQPERIALVSSGSMQRNSQESLVMTYLNTMGFATVYFESEDVFLMQSETFDIAMIFHGNTLYRTKEYKNRAGKFILITGIMDDYSLLEPDEVIHFPLYGSKLFSVIDEHLRHSVRKEKKTLARRASSRYHSHILVVEDNMVNQKLIKIILDKMGCDVTVASNGLEAITAFRNNRFDLIFMDINMPVMDGCEATREILQIEKAKKLPHTPIIALTANIQKGDRERFLSIGMDDYIPKPITQHMVESAMSNFIALESRNVKEKEPIVIFSDETLDLASALSGLGVDAEMIFELIGEFLDNYRSSRTELYDAVKNSNIKEARHLAHKYKGASGNLRMPNLYKYFKELESSIEDRKKSEVLLQEIESEISAIADRIPNT